MESTPGYKYPSASRQTPKKHCMPPRGKRTFGADEEPAFVGDGTAQSKCQYPGEERPDAARASSTSLAGSPISARKASAVAAVGLEMITRKIGRKLPFVMNVFLGICAFAVTWQHL